MNSQYFENLQILFHKKSKGITDLISTDCKKFTKCTLHYQGNYVIIETDVERSNTGEMRFTVFPLKSIKEFRTLFPKVPPKFEFPSPK
jgi:hypothetical protein